MDADPTPNPNPAPQPAADAPPVPDAAQPAGIDVAAALRGAAAIAARNDAERKTARRRQAVAGTGKRLGRPPKGDPSDPRGKSGIWHVYLPPTDAQATKLREAVERHLRKSGIPLSVWLKKAALAQLARETSKAAAEDEALRTAVTEAVAAALAAERATRRRGKPSKVAQP